MVTLDSDVFVSTKKFEFKNVSIQNVVDKKEDFFLLSMNTRYKTFNFVPVETATLNNYNGTLVDINLVNNQGIEYKLTVTPNCELVTLRGNVKPHIINELDVFYDIKGITCKLLTKTFYEASNVNLAYISSLYTHNFFCNNILIKNN